MKIRADACEYVHATVSADHDLTGCPIDVALPRAGEPALTWIPAQVTSVISTPGSWTATYRILVGQGGDVELGPGLYDWTMRVIDNPERPVRITGQLTVTVS